MSIDYLRYIRHYFLSNFLFCPSNCYHDYLPSFTNAVDILRPPLIVNFPLAICSPLGPSAFGSPISKLSKSYVELLYVGFIAVSGFSALALAIFYKRLKTYFSDKPTRLIVPLIYVVIMITAYIVFPPNPDKITIPSSLITSFRIASVSTIGIFWGVLGMIVGVLWDKFKLHETNRVAPSSSSDTFLR